MTPALRSLVPLALATAASVWAAPSSPSMTTLTIPVPGTNASIQADSYGSGPRALILAHGGRFDRASWKKQAPQFAALGYHVLALSFRGDTHNPDGSPSAEGSAADNAKDVLAAAAYLRAHGATSISGIGGSLGGDAIGDAAAQSPPGAWDRLVFLGSEGGSSPQQLQGRKLFLVAREDRSGDGLRLPGITKAVQAAPEPKQFIVLDGSAHAQFLFTSPEADRALDEIVRFLRAL